jgi:hypothetical protein
MKSQVGDICQYIEPECGWYTNKSFKVTKVTEGETFGIWIEESPSNQTTTNFGIDILLAKDLWKLVKRNNKTCCEKCKNK